MQVVLSATVTQACVQIVITDDTFLEDDETFTLSLAAEPPAMLSSATSTVTITDDGMAAAYIVRLSAKSFRLCTLPPPPTHHTAPQILHLLDLSKPLTQ